MKLLIDKSDAAIITSPAAETFGFSKSRFTAWNKVEFPLVYTVMLEKKHQSQLIRQQILQTLL